MVRSGKKVLHFYNNSDSLENIIRFLENVQKKIDYINLTVSVEGNRTIKITLFGPRDLQNLASERLRNLAQQILKR